MTIDEAIEHEKMLVMMHTQFTDSVIQKELKEEAQQRAEWLEELKRRREHDGEIIGSGALNNAYNQGYNKAIDDFEKEMIRSYLTEREKEYIRYKAEQLKAGGTDE